jgi:hypothetical protein
LLAAWQFATFNFTVVLTDRFAREMIVIFALPFLMAFILPVGVTIAILLSDDV